MPPPPRTLPTWLPWGVEAVPVHRCLWLMGWLSVTGQ